MDQGTMNVRMQYWANLIDAQIKSGLSITRWCAENNISRTIFHRWSKKYREYLLAQNGASNIDMLSKEVTETAFVEIACHDSIPLRRQINDGAIKITYGGFNVEIQGQVDMDNLSTVLKVISNV